VETPAPVVAVKSRGHAPVRPKSGAVARKPADSLAKEAASPAAPSSPAVATAASSLAATPADAGSSPGGGTRGEAAAAPSGVAPARQGEVCADGDVRRYRAALTISAERLKRYPPLARERAWEGRVEIALDFRPGEPALSLAASSGHGILDEQALETLRQAVRQTEPPTGLKGRDCRIRQALTFSLVE
jgi:TonB family protein